MRPSVILLALPLAAATCFYPDGSLADGDTQCSVFADGVETHSTCCGPGYACMSNNMCRSTGQEAYYPGASIFVRGSCTDQSWDSSDCPRFCINGDAPYHDNLKGGNGIGMCDGIQGSIFYCINSAKVNCEAGVNVLNFDATPTVLTTIGWVPPSDTSKPTTTAKAPTTAPDTTTTATSTPSASSTSNTDTVAIAVGVSIGIAGIAAAGAIGFLLLRRRRRAAATSPSWPTNSYPHLPGPGSPHLTSFNTEESYKGFGSANATEHIPGLEVFEPAHCPPAFPTGGRGLHSSGGEFHSSGSGLHVSSGAVHNPDGGLHNPGGIVPPLSPAPLAWTAPAPVSAITVGPVNAFSPDQVGRMGSVSSVANAAMRSPSLPNMHRRNTGLAPETPAPPYSALAADVPGGGREVTLARNDAGPMKSEMM